MIVKMRFKTQNKDSKSVLSSTSQYNKNLYWMSNQRLRNRRATGVKNEHIDIEKKEQTETQYI